MQPVQNILPQDYASLRQAGSPPTLIDVREPWEFEIARIQEAQLMPLGQIYEWAASLDKDAPYVVVCHHGSRSAMACQVMGSLGFRNVRNLDGGVDAWAYAVDASIGRY
jgi:rhodanese-related sulfurtransferase